MSYGRSVPSGGAGHPGGEAQGASPQVDANVGADEKSRVAVPLRTDVEFVSQGVTCRGWLYEPGGVAPTACVVMAHGFAGIKEMRLDAFAERFAAAGCRVLVFDYRHFGASDGEPRQLLDIARQQEDWRAAVSFARARAGGLPLVLWGTSFSGGHVITLAAEDDGVAAVIALVPYLSGIASARAITLAQGLRLGRVALEDWVRAALGRSPRYVAAIGRPGELAAMTAPGELEAMLELVPSGLEVDNRVAARVFLAIARYSPGRYAARIAVPLLVQAATRDQTTPYAAAAAAAARAPRCELLTYDCGHFDVYVSPDFERSVSDQIAFLRRHAIVPE